MSDRIESDAKDRRRDGDENDAGARALAGHVLRVREGHGANCSSIGSIVDTLFVTAVAGGAVLAALAAMMRARPEDDGDDRPSDDACRPSEER
jgi:hypothetical protein